MLHRLLSLLLITLASISLMSSPAAAQTAKCGRGGQVFGALVGGLAGGFLGNRVDGGRKRGVGTVLGALGGALVGSAIGNKLNTCEQQKLEAATIAAADSSAPGPQAWKSDTRPEVHGTAVAAPIMTAADGRQCRTITRVSYIAGEEVRDEPRVCRVPPVATWSVAA